MNALEFMSGRPFLTFFLAYILGQLILKSWSLFWRHWSIKKHGWPPEHCDADGGNINKKDD
jgi:hypothetical protein